MNKLISFSSDISTIQLPKIFDYPFYYTPHLIAKIAANELQQYLTHQTDFIHDFGFDKNSDGIGKMFGVLVVKNQNNELGYLCAFSGKLADKTIHKHFVPPVFDVLNPKGFYRKTEDEINEINNKIEALTSDKNYNLITENINKIAVTHQQLLNTEKQKIKTRRQLRKLEDKVDNQQNLNEEFYLREYEVYLNDKVSIIQQEYIIYEKQIEDLKQLRKEKSAKVQAEIFEHYKFINTNHQQKNLKDIFSNHKQNIPAGAGDCCAPKLFQYAFLHDLTPIAMAEFWWGKPLKTSIRKHKYFYPACKGKCKPILEHMLSGIPVKENPLFEKLAEKKEIKIIYEDEYLLVINKPHELLSVSGSEIEDSVEHRIRQKYPDATGPLLVHRLDMSTSGILLIAKKKDVHKALQSQFINKTVKKRYVALLDGKVNKPNGKIELPLRVDFFDRPKQMVCFDRGKKAITKYEVIETYSNTTKVYFYPITGRTHQLRMHAAHHQGLNSPIVGDDLYGIIKDRLYLHAERIEFVHPITEKKVSFIADCPF